MILYLIFTVASPSQSGVLEYHMLFFVPWPCELAAEHSSWSGGWLDSGYIALSDMHCVLGGGTCIPESGGRAVISFWSDNLICVCTGTGPQFLSLPFFLSFISFSLRFLLYDLGWMGMEGVYCVHECLFISSFVWRFAFLLKMYGRIDRLLVAWFMLRVSSSSVLKGSSIAC